MAPEHDPGVEGRLREVLAEHGSLDLEDYVVREEELLAW
jgi:hypothetical protein